jgi:hypothetical protein
MAPCTFELPRNTTLPVLLAEVVMAGVREVRDALFVKISVGRGAGPTSKVAAPELSTPNVEPAGFNGVMYGVMGPEVAVICCLGS